MAGVPTDAESMSLPIIPEEGGVAMMYAAEDTADIGGVQASRAVNSSEALPPSTMDQGELIPVTGGARMDSDVATGTAPISTPLEPTFRADESSGREHRGCSAAAAGTESSFTMLILLIGLVSRRLRRSAH